MKDLGVSFPRAKLWDRVCALLATAFVPLDVRTSWQWYRRALGGRWALTPFGRRWRQVAVCPGPMWSALLGGESVPVGVCFDCPITGEAECHCEVWP